MTLSTNKPAVSLLDIFPEFVLDSSMTNAAGKHNPSSDIQGCIVWFGLIGYMVGSWFGIFRLYGLVGFGMVLIYGQTPNGQKRDKG